MTQVTLTDGINFNSLSAAQLADLLAKARAAEKARKSEIQALPKFAFFVVMADGTVTPWSGQAVDSDAAQVAAIVHAESKGEVFKVDGKAAIVARPIPAPRGRKAKSATVESPDADSAS